MFDFFIKINSLTDTIDVELSEWILRQIKVAGQLTTVSSQFSQLHRQNTGGFSVTVKNTVATITRLKQYTDRIFDILMLLKNLGKNKFSASKYCYWSSKAGDTGRGLVAVVFTVLELGQKTRLPAEEVAAWWNTIKSSALTAVDLMKEGQETAKNSSQQILGTIDKVHTVKSAMEMIVTRVQAIKAEHVIEYNKNMNEGSIKPKCVQGMS